MTRDDALTIVRNILSDKLGVEPEEVVPGAHLRDDLALDSLDAVELIQGVQEEFGERLAPEEVAAVDTVGDVLDLMQRRAAERAAS